MLLQAERFLGPTDLAPVDGASDGLGQRLARAPGLGTFDWLVLCIYNISRANISVI